MFFEEIILGTEIDLEPAFDNDGSYMVMFNPEIVKKSAPFDTQECLYKN